MADLSVMGFLNEETQQETEYNLKDAQARESINTINSKIPSAASSNNKLVDATAMNDAIGQAVSAAYKPAGNKTVAELTSSLLVAANRGKVYNMTDAGTTTADFVEGAGHPIRVGDDIGICEPTTGTFKFNILSGFIAVDTNPTQGSANPVSSGGVYSEFAGIKNGQSIDSFGDVETALAGKVDKVQGKGLSTNDYTNTAKGIVDNIQDNVIANTKLIKDTVGWSGKNKLPNNASSRTDNGVTFTVNADGSITANGTATNDASNGWNAGKIKAGKYILSGCPANGSNSTYYIRIGTANSESDTWGSYLAEETGNGRLITLEADTYLTINVRVMNGQTVNNLIFYPMLCDPDILDATAYESYHKDVVNTLRDAEVIKGKNLLSPKWQVGTGTGITFTVNSDGSVTANGTASGDNTFIIPKPDMLADTPLILNGCPSGGSGTTYFMQYTNEVDNAYNDFGSGVNITKFNYTTYANAKIVIKIKSGQTVNNLVFKPMIRLATETDPTYEPHYIPLKDSMFPRSEQTVLGAKNLLPNNATSQTTSGITYTVNSNGIVNANGTATGNAFLNYPTFVLKAGTYILSQGFACDNIETRLQLAKLDTTVVAIINSLGAKETKFTLLEDTEVRAQIRIGNGLTVNNLTFYPMLRLASDTDSTYAPYAMTNKELTDRLVKNSIYEVVSSGKGIDFRFERKDNIVTMSVVGEATEAIANNAKIIDIPSDYQFDFHNDMFMVYKNVISGEHTGVITVKPTAIMCNTPISVGDKPRGCFTSAH